MKKQVLFLFCLSFLHCSSKSTAPESIDGQDILELLQAIPGMEVTEITPSNGCSRQFDVYIEQPLDHDLPQGETFQQHLYISHTDMFQPVVFMPSGYATSPVKVGELTTRLYANQIYVAHRFMLGARPSSMDWQYLTIRQASADFHRIVTILKAVYKGPWVSYGVSKNGQAALYHKRFYPDDVCATVTVGAALSKDVQDVRYEEFLKTVGTAQDRETLRQFQRHVLIERDALIPMINAYMAQSEFNFSRLSAGAILEYEVLEFPFGFWQSTSGDCSTIPDSSATSEVLFAYLKEFGYFDVYSDELLEFYQPVYYQAFTELGWYRLIDEPVRDLLRVLQQPSHRALAPPEAAMQYDPQIMTDVLQWLQNFGNNIIYIYGDRDPWSAGAIESTGATNALKIIQPGANHNVKIADCDQANQIDGALEQWMNDMAEADLVKGGNGH